MRIAICDDEDEQLRLMDSFLRRYDRALEVDVYSAAIDLLLSAESRCYDVVFMDIEMPSPNGFEVAKQLRERANPPLIIFVTKSSAYTIQGYGVAFRYLAKPLEYEHFSSILALALKERAPAKISISCDGVQHIIPVNKIAYCETMDHSLSLYVQGQRYTLRMPLAEFAAQLPPEDFAQPHKSYLVNLDYVRSVSVNNVALSLGDGSVQIPLSKGKRRQFIQRLGDYIGR